MPNDNVLKPCPFCGGDVKHIQGLPPLDDSHFIDCPGCGVSSKIASTKEAVIEAWNRRAHPGQPEPRAEVADEPSLANPLTPYGMLVRALRIVSGTLLYDMAKSMSLSPATLSAMEFGRRPATYAEACGAADFFASRGLLGTLQALEFAIDASRIGVSR